MAIGHYIKEIGRGREGARALDRLQAADLMGQILDAQVSDLEIGAFCLAMRIKGETPEEMAGFLDAAHGRLHRLQGPADAWTVVLPSYNGARRLPLMTPLLAQLLAREGLAVVVHGCTTESTRVTSEQVFAAMGVQALRTPRAVMAGEAVFVPTEVLSADLKRLLDVRRVVGLRNPAHSLVKLMNPMVGNTLLVSSYTHPEYALSMAATFELTGERALLLRGTEGEAVADARRCPSMEAFVKGQRTSLVEGQSGSLTRLPDWPNEIDPETTARYSAAVLKGDLAVPESLARQVQAVLQAIHL
jgi:anthranilate phosphoribosyltransferase